MNPFLPFVSIVVPTYNREEVLCQTITYLLTQNYPTYEIVVVDQTTNHNTSTQEYLKKHAADVRYFQLAQPSLPKARNFGVQQAKGEIIVFVDDDVEVDKNWLNAHIKNFHDASIGGISGRIIEDNVPIINTTEIGRVTKWGRVIGNRASTARTQIEWASGGNASFRRILVEKVGGFDEAFQGNAIFEDTDFSFRLRSLGYKIYFDPEAVLIHLAVRQGGCETRTKDRVNYYYWFLHNKTLFFMKNFPPYYWPLMFITNFLRAIKVGLVESQSVKTFFNLCQAMLAGSKLYRQNRR
ncbi:MAG: glycosyltransferase family 2 protein [Chloroflexi bacterium]|nr:glycosyltransferase family 2 protein [Chloroflexota bacterium]